MTAKTETTWTSEVRTHHIHLRCVTGPVGTVADRFAIEQRLEAGEGDAFVGTLERAAEVAGGRRGKTRWRVVLVEAVGPAGAAYVPVLLVGTKPRVRAIHGRASRDLGRGDDARQRVRGRGTRRPGGARRTSAACGIG